MQDAVIRNIEIIGEAANRISSEFSAKHDAIPWRDIAGMRHRLIHGYFKVNLNTVGKVVEKDLPELEDQVHALLDELDIEAYIPARMGEGLRGFLLRNKRIYQYSDQIYPVDLPRN